MRRVVLDLDEDDLDVGALLAQGAQGAGEQLGGRGLEDPDAQRLALAALHGGDVGSERLDLAQHPPGAPVGDIAGGGERRWRRGRPGG